jgi:mRNA-degrading endonuclease toxin of MazEF toxin-antitoxin module
LAARQPIRQGDVYWVDDFPPLHGDVAKRRPVVVITPTADARSAEQIVVVACTSTVLPSGTEAIELPNTGRTPQARSGLHRQTWAIPEWWLPVAPDRLTDYAGFIRGAVLARVVVSAQGYIRRDLGDGNLPK